MRIIVTGAKGQLGTEIQKCFERGYTELGVPEILKSENEVCYVDIDTVDIADIGALRALFAEFKPEAVINCAAFTKVDACETTDRETSFKANALGPRNLAMACEEIGAKLVHVSTDYVFAGDGDKPYVEYDICAPQSVYGSTKYLGEEYVKQFSTKYFIVRTAWL